MQDFWSIVRLDLFVSVPQAFTLTWLTFALLGLRPVRRWKRVLTLAAVNSVYTDLFVRILPTPVHLLNSVAITTLMLWILFKDIPWKKKIFVLLLSYIIGAINDVAVFYVYGLFYGNNGRDHFLNNAPTYISCLYPTLLVQWLAAAALDARAARWFESMRSAGGFIRRNGLVEVLVCLLIQLLTGLSVLGARVIPGEYDQHPAFDYLFFTTVLMCLPTLYFILRLIDRTRQRTVLATQEHYIEQISGMFTSIRGQRHDFLNHIQVMHTMLQMGKLADLKAYMAEIVKETQEVGDIVHHRVPAAAALLKAKTAVALGLGIDFTSEFKGSWDPQSPVSVIDIVKIAGNLIDNAFEEVVKLPAGKRRVRVAFRSDDGYLEIAVSNPGPPIAEAARARLFEPGYTTKKAGTADSACPSSKSASLITRER